MEMLLEKSDLLERLKVLSFYYVDSDVVNITINVDSIEEALTILMTHVN